jgi:hypothetical protein
MRRVVADLAVVLLLLGSPAAACPTLPLHVAATASPPVFSTDPAVAFPHVRVPVTRLEAYRVGAATRADWPTLHLDVRRGPGPDEVTLLATPPCAPEALPFDAGATYVRELHVATTGSGAGDGSPGDPFGTIAQAAAGAGPGDRILVHEGRYRGSNWVPDLQGTADLPVLITGVPGEQAPVLGSTSVAEALHLVDPAWVVLQDLVVEGPTGNGINVDDGGDYATPAHHVIFRRLTIRDVGTGGNQDCLKLSGLDDFLVTELDVQRCGTGGSGIDMVGCHDGLIAASTFRQAGANAIQAKGGTADVLIHGNLMVDCGPRAMNLGGSTGLAFFRPPGANWEARNVQAIANVVVGSDAPVAYVGCDGCLAASNTFWLPRRWFARILQETTEPGFITCRDGRYLDNIIVFDRASVSPENVNVGPATAPGTFTFANNLWFARDDPAWPGPNLPVAETDGIVGLDPRLADPAGEDFHLQAGSPALAAGTCYLELVRDRDDLCYENPPDLGAHVAP